MAVLHELDGPIDARALADVVEDRLVAGLEAHQQQTQAVLLHDLEGLERDVGLGVARPRDAELAEATGDRLGARPVVGERIVVEEELAHLRKQRLGVRHLRDHVVDTARAVDMAGDGLRPEAETQLAAAAAAGIQRHVRMLQVADIVVFDGEMLGVDVGDVRDGVEVVDRRTHRGTPDRAVRRAVGDARHVLERPPLRQFLAST